MRPSGHRRTWPITGLTLGFIAGLVWTLAPAASGAATLVVDSAGDLADSTPGDGICATAEATCTLRAAIETANEVAGADTIAFEIPSTSPSFDALAVVVDISPAGPLPSFGEAVTLDATTQSEFGTVGRPVVRLNGGLEITADSVVVRGLWIEGGVVVDSADGIHLDRIVATGSTAGVHVTKSTGSVIESSWIGVSPDGVPVPNAGAGVRLGKFSSDTLVTGNTIHHNAGAGVSLDVNAASGHAIVANSIADNGGLAIDIRDDGVTPNDGGDGDSGPNELMNFPVVAAGTTDSTQLVVDVELDTAAGIYRIDVYDVATADPLGHGELDRHVGSEIVEVVSPLQAFTLTFPGESAANITATATKCLDASCSGLGPTSEAAPNAFVVPIPPPATTTTTSSTTTTSTTGPSTTSTAGPSSTTTSSTTTTSTTSTTGPSSTSTSSTTTTSTTSTTGPSSTSTTPTTTVASTAAPSTNTSTTPPTTTPPTTAPPSTSTPAEPSGRFPGDDDTPGQAGPDGGAVNSSTPVAVGAGRDPGLFNAIGQSLLASEPPTVAPSTESSSGGLLDALLAVLTLIREASMPIWPFLVAAAIGLGGLVSAWFLPWARRLYVLTTDGVTVTDSTGVSHRLPISGDPMWGRRMPGSRIVRLSTPFGRLKVGVDAVRPASTS